MVSSMQGEPRHSERPSAFAMAPTILGLATAMFFLVLGGSWLLTSKNPPDASTRGVSASPSLVAPPDVPNPTTPVVAEPRVEPSSAVESVLPPARSDSKATPHEKPNPALIHGVFRPRTEPPKAAFSPEPPPPPATPVPAPPPHSTDEGQFVYEHNPYIRR
jgi:hypothetical protein